MCTVGYIGNYNLVKVDINELGRKTFNLMYTNNVDVAQFSTECSIYFRVILKYKFSYIFSVWFCSTFSLSTFVIFIPLQILIKFCNKLSEI